LFAQLTGSVGDFCALFCFGDFAAGFFFAGGEVVCLAFEVVDVAGLAGMF